MKIAVIGEGRGKGVVAPVFEKLGREIVVVSPRDNEVKAEVMYVLRAKPIIACRRATRSKVSKC